MGLGYAYRGNILVFTVDVFAEVFLYTAHSYDCVVAECLDHLQWGEEAVLVNALEDRIQFVTCFFKNLRAGCEIC